MWYPENKLDDAELDEKGDMPVQAFFGRNKELFLMQPPDVPTLFLLTQSRVWHVYEGEEDESEEPSVWGEMNLHRVHDGNQIPLSAATVFEPYWEAWPGGPRYLRSYARVRYRVAFRPPYSGQALWRFGHARFKLGGREGFGLPTESGTVDWQEPSYASAGPDLWMPDDWHLPVDVNEPESWPGQVGWRNVAVPDDPSVPDGYMTASSERLFHWLWPHKDIAASLDDRWRNPGVIPGVAMPGAKYLRPRGLSGGPIGD